MKIRQEDEDRRTRQEESNVARIVDSPENRRTRKMMRVLQTREIL
jgi:hypothetical protein